MSRLIKYRPDANSKTFLKEQSFHVLYKNAEDHKYGYTYLSDRQNERVQIIEQLVRRNGRRMF